jgi:hypothetical protein
MKKFPVAIFCNSYIGIQRDQSRAKRIFPDFPPFNVKCIRTRPLQLRGIRRGTRDENRLRIRAQNLMSARTIASQLEGARANALITLEGGRYALL